MNDIKTLWYFNHYIPSSDAPKKGRAFFLLNAVAEENINVAVVGASRHHLVVEQEDQATRFKFQEVDRVLFGWIRTPRYSGNGLKRIINMFSYAWQLLLLPRQMPAKYARPDVIIASSVHPFHYPIALMLALRFRAKIVFEVRDIWPRTLHDLMGVPKWHPFYLMTACVERLAYRTADRVISLMGNGLAHMQSRGLKPERFSYVPNGTLFSESDTILTSCDHDQQLKEIRSLYNHVLMYTGAHGQPNALDQLIEAAALVQNDTDDVAIVLVGAGIEKTRLKECVKSKKLAHVFFLDSVPAVQVPCVLSYADTCFIGWQGKDIYKFGISANKLFEYMKARKPIIQCIESPNNPVALSGCGVDLLPQHSSALADVIIQFSQKTKEELEAMGNKGYEYAYQEHNYKRLAKRFIEACNA